MPIKGLISIVVIVVLGVGGVCAQSDSKTTSETLQVYHLPYVVKGNDTIPIYTPDETVQVVEFVSAEEKKKQEEWRKLVYNVHKVIGYAEMFANKRKELDSSLAALDKRKDKRKYLKAEEDKLRDDLEKKLHQLTYDQGKLLIKLISRETGHSAFSLIKEYKSGVTASAWQGAAKIFGMNLKDVYDPTIEPTIEQAIQFLGYK